MKFIVAHSNVFYTILRDQDAETPESLQELSLLTAVLSRAAINDSSDSPYRLCPLCRMSACLCGLLNDTDVCCPRYRPRRETAAV